MRKFMKVALEEAKLAIEKGEVPVGAIVVKDDEIIGRAHNEVEIRKDSTAHAEILAIRQAAKALGNWRLNGCALYVTLEPCIMCMGAIFNSRISKLVYGAGDSKMGAVDAQGDFLRSSLFKNIQIYPGILEEECQDILKEFFKQKREIP